MPISHLAKSFEPQWDKARWGSMAPGTDAGSANVAFDVLKSAFADVAHALGNPLTGLTLSLERLASLASEERVLKMVQRIEQAAERLGTIKTLWAELGAAASQQPASAVAPEQMAAWLTSRPANAERPLQISIAEDVRGLCVHAHAMRWALCELLDNAERHGGGDVGFDIFPKDDRCRLVVWQQKGQLPEALVEPLWRRPLTRAHGRGQGAGLLMVAFITEELHHGQVAYVPGKDGGAAMVVDVPLRSMI